MRCAHTHAAVVFIAVAVVVKPCYFAEKLKTKTNIVAKKKKLPKGHNFTHCLLDKLLLLLLFFDYDNNNHLRGVLIIEEIKTRKMLVLK